MVQLNLSKNTRAPFKVTTLELSVPDLPQEFNGYRMVQLTDLHFGPLTPERHIQKALLITKELNPDLLLLTGDYVQYSKTGVRHILATRVHPKRFRWLEYRRQVRLLTERLAQMLTPIEPTDGIIGVFGNHDYLEGLGTIRRQMPQRIVWLKNSYRTITRNGRQLVIAGTDDHRYGAPDLKRTVAFEGNGYNPVCKILLAHNPDVTVGPDAELLDRFDLVLSGHTHGGQICLPSGIPIITQTKQRIACRGLNRAHNTNLYISNGVGYGGISVRLFCPPEITLITLQRSQAGARPNQSGCRIDAQR